MSKESLMILGVRDIAARLGVSVAQVAYAIKKLDMDPRANVSGVRVFFEEDLPAIQTMINSVRPPEAVLPKRKG